MDNLAYVGSFIRKSPEIRNPGVNIHVAFSHLREKRNYSP
jgi:hypothetical protein